MNKLVNNLFSIFLPFVPFWGYFFWTVIGSKINIGINAVAFTIVFYYVIYERKRLSNFLIFFIFFTIYHIAVAIINDIPRETSKFYYVFNDDKVLACLLFIIIEHTTFTEKFIKTLSRNILIVVGISLIVSLIQVKTPSCFFNKYWDQDLAYIGENRDFSIYSWTGLNSAGITFPILISILLNVYSRRKSIIPFVIFANIIVSFLTKTRYVMISAILVMSQLFFDRMISLKKRVIMVVVLVSTVLLIGWGAEKMGYDINEVINGRIMEKDSDMASAKARVLSYEVFLKIFPNDPIFGVGPSTRNDVKELLGGEAPLIHVGYLSYLYYYGIVGFILFMIASIFLFRDAWIVGRKEKFWGTFYGLLTFYIANFTMVYFIFSEMGIIVSMLFLKYYQDKSLSKNSLDLTLQNEAINN